MSLLAVTALLAACTTRSDRPSAASSEATPPPVVLDGGELFQPLPNVPADALTAEEALAAYTAHRRHPVTHLLPGVRASYGLFTLATRHSTKTLRVWALSTGPQDCMMTGMTTPSPWPQCIEWDFLDAFGGRFIIPRQQDVS
jgi:hypothetical protein